MSEKAYELLLLDCHCTFLLAEFSSLMRGGIPPACLMASWKSALWGGGGGRESFNKEYLWRTKGGRGIEIGNSTFIGSKSPYDPSRHELYVVIIICEKRNDSLFPLSLNESGCVFH